MNQLVNFDLEKITQVLKGYSKCLGWDYDSLLFQLLDYERHIKILHRWHPEISEESIRNRYAQLVAVNAAFDETVEFGYNGTFASIWRSEPDAMKAMGFEKKNDNKDY